MEISILDEDIAMVRVDALLTVIKGDGMWYSKVDDAILGAASNRFHDQAAEALEKDPATRVIVASPLKGHYGLFDRVIFVVDDSGLSLAEVILLGLQTAAAEGFKTIVMPAIRLGGEIEISARLQEQRVGEIVSTLKEYGQNTSLDSVTVVVKDNRELFSRFHRAL